MTRLLPLGGAVQHGGLVQGAVNAGDAGQIHDHAVAGALPYLQNHEERGPIGRLGIPAVALSAKEGHDAVEHAVVRVQEREHEIAHHDPRQEVREEHQRLIRLGQALGIQFVDHDGQRHRNDDAQNDEHDVVKKRVAQKHREGVVVDKEAEVLKADKLAVQQVIKEALLREDFVLNERDHQSEHGQIAKQNIPD